MGEARRLRAIPGGISVGMSGEGQDGAAALHLPCMKESDMGVLEALRQSAGGGTPPTITTTLPHSECSRPRPRAGPVGHDRLMEYQISHLRGKCPQPSGFLLPHSNCSLCYSAADVGVPNTTGDPPPHGESMTSGTWSGVAQLGEARGGPHR